MEQLGDSFTDRLQGGKTSRGSDYTRSTFMNRLRWLRTLLTIWLIRWDLGFSSSSKMHVSMLIWAREFTPNTSCTNSELTLCPSHRYIMKPFSRNKQLLLKTKEFLNQNKVSVFNSHHKHSTFRLVKSKTYNNIQLCKMVYLYYSQSC